MLYLSYNPTYTHTSEKCAFYWLVWIRACSIVPQSYSHGGFSGTAGPHPLATLSENWVLLQGFRNGQWERLWNEIWESIWTVLGRARCGLCGLKLYQSWLWCTDGFCSQAMGNEVEPTSFALAIIIILSCFRYPPEQHPVIALKGAPAKYPVRKEHRHLQKYLKWSKRKLDEAQEYINNTIGDNPYLAIHLRMGKDWVRLSISTHTLVLAL